MSQINEIYNILSDNLPHRSDQIQEKMFGSTKVGLFRLAARINDLKNKGHQIIGWKDKMNPKLYWYQLYKQQSGDIAPIINKAGFNSSEFKSRVSPDCCPSYQIFKTHAQSCPQREENKVKQLF